MTNYFHLLHNFAVYYLQKLSSARKSMPQWENSLSWWCYSQYMWQKQQTHVYSGFRLINVGSGCQSWLAEMLNSGHESATPLNLVSGLGVKWWFETRVIWFSLGRNWAEYIWVAIVKLSFQLKPRSNHLSIFSECSASINLTPVLGTSFPEWWFGSDACGCCHSDHNGSALSPQIFRVEVPKNSPLSSHTQSPPNLPSPFHVQSTIQLSVHDCFRSITAPAQDWNGAYFGLQPTYSSLESYE